MSDNLMPTWQIGDVYLTEYPYSVDRDNAVEIGEPEMVVESLTSMLADGDIERTVRHGNRAYVIPCYVEGPDLLSVAEAEATLRRELTRQGVLLTHDPGDGFAPASVYEVLTAQMTPERSDTHESHLLRKFVLTLTCGPFARSVDPVTVDAVPVDGVLTTVTVDTCDSTTGWAISGDDVALSVVSGAVSVQTSDPAITTVQPRREVAVDFTTTPYLIAEWRFSSTGGTTLSDSGNSLRVQEGTTSFPVVQSVSLADGWRRSAFLVDGPTAFLMFTADAAAAYRDTLWRFEIRDLKRSNVPSETPRQITRIIETGGAERTPASIHVESANGTDDLGTVLVHTSPEDGSGYSPPLRRWRAGGNAVTADSAATSGATEPIHPDAVYADVPIGALPEGGYLIVARMKSSVATTLTINWGVLSTFPTSPVEGGVAGTVDATFGMVDTYRHIPVAVVSLPTVRGAGEVRVSLQYTGGAATVTLDEFWLFRIDDACALTIVDDAPAHLWLDSPDTSSSVPTVWIGSSSDRTDARHPGSKLAAMGSHVLHPEGTAVFTAANTDHPETDATFYRRWHSNAAS